MNEPLANAIRVFNESGGDFNDSLAHCLAFGEVQSNADFFCMGYPQGDQFYVKMLAGDFAKCAKHNLGRFKTICYKREFKGSGKMRTINIEKLKRHGGHVTMAIRD